ncbi:MAG TPA: Crp/Fnr family transcriptional regulator [Thermoleophilaceae bacterium]|nr:Crp/Fnr family transcriptional regulator [Thermoleophilaceae bacterium]
MNVVEEDPDLAQHLCAGRLEQVGRDAVAGLAVVDTGGWLAPEQLPAERGALGLLVLEGAVVRSVSVGGRHGLELLGAGDLVRAFEPAGDVQGTAPAEVGWWALIPTRLAVLDEDFTSRMCSYPEVIDQLSGRLERRSSTHALRLTINQQPRLSTRLHFLLWHLADRFGRVHSGGVLLPLPLSHELIAQLVGAQRPSVSRALKQLEQAELIARRPDGSWWLGGQPPVGARC